MSMAYTYIGTLCVCYVVNGKLDIVLLQRMKSDLMRLDATFGLPHSDFRACCQQKQKCVCVSMRRIGNEEKNVLILFGYTAASVSWG